MKVTQYAGCVSANTRLHQLCWGYREWVYYMSCTRNTDDWPWTALKMFLGTLLPSGSTQWHIHGQLIIAKLHYTYMYMCMYIVHATWPLCYCSVPGRPQHSMELLCLCHSCLETLLSRYRKLHQEWYTCCTVYVHVHVYNAMCMCMYMYMYVLWSPFSTYRYWMRMP